MKQVKLIAILLCLSYTSWAQTVTPNLGPYQNISTKYQYTWQKWSGGLWNLGKLIQQDSAYFTGITYVPTALDADSNTKVANTQWVRKWIADNVSPGIPGTPTRAWNYKGNYSDADPTKGRLGFIDSFPLHFITNSQIRLSIPDNGINRSAGLANKVLMIDTVTKKVYYTDMTDGGGGSGITSLGSGWGLNNVNDSTYEVDSSEVASLTALADTAAAIRADFPTPVDISGKLNISDTAAMLAPYATYNQLDSSLNEIPYRDSTYLRITGNSLGSASSFTKGLDLQNYTPATAIDRFQGSPSIRLGTSVWTTGSGGASATREWVITARNSTIGALGTNTIGGLYIQTYVNGIPEKTPLTIERTGVLTVGGIIAGGSGSFFGKLTINQPLQNATPENILLLNNHAGGVSAISPNHAPPRIFQSGLIWNGSAGIIAGIGYEAINTTATSNYLKLVSQFDGGPFGDIIGFHSSQQVGMGSSITTPAASALLDMGSTTQGFLPPRMTTTEINAITSPATGLTIYNTTENTICFFNGTTWQKVTSTNL